MKIIFLDIDGVLNNCMSAGVFSESSTKKECINILNKAIESTSSKIIIISSWKDSYKFEIIRDLLYERGIIKDSIVGHTEKDVQKEIGITDFLTMNKIEKFVIIDDNLQFANNLYNKFYVKPISMIGLQNEHLENIINILS